MTPRGCVGALGTCRRSSGSTTTSRFRRTCASTRPCTGCAARHARRESRSSFSELGLEERKNQLAGTLSGGWKQRLALACATSHEPEVLFLDEPTAGVDPASRRLFWEWIYALAKAGTTILVTTHYMDEAARCTRLAFLSRGHLIAVGTQEEITRQFGQETVEDVFIELQRRDEGTTGPAASGQRPEGGQRSAADGRVEELGGPGDA